MSIFVGIDPSLNSTGVCIQHFDGDTMVKEQYFIIKPNKLTKKEKEADEKYLYFDYVLYEKYDLKEYKDDNHLHEYYKTVNFINAVDKIMDVLKQNVTNANDNEVFIVQEGISYGSSLRTKSVFDLAGLNYLIRERIMKYNKDWHIFIATPSEIKKFGSGSGNCPKAVLILEFSALKPDFKLPKIDDICDAFFMSSYAKYLYDKKLF